MPISEELTPEQQAKLPEYADKWINIGLSTEEMDVSKVPGDLELIYREAGVPAPQDIIYTSSPIAGVYLARICEGLEKWDRNISLDLEALKTRSADCDSSSVIHFLCYGQFDASWLSFYDFFKTELKLEVCNRLNGFFGMAQNTGWFFPFDKATVVCDRPAEINLDDEGRLHNEDGYAISWRDGWGFCSIHGARVPRYVVFEPEKITVDDIDSESNQEVKRIKIDKFGTERYLSEGDAKLLHEDDFGKLYKKEIDGDEDLIMVKVVNSSAEPDGTFKDYFLRVPPHVRTAREAVAWTFEKDDPKTYKPVAES